MSTLNDQGLDQLFRSARSLHTFSDRPVEDATLHAVYDLLKWGPTAFNAQPARYVFLRSAVSKARLQPALSAGNRAKTLQAPVTVIVAYDPEFYRDLPRLFPPADVQGMFSGNPAAAQSTAFRNGSLQGAYLLIAARALGLTAGPMSGFDTTAVDREFFPDGRYRSNFLVNLGYGADVAPPPRLPRYEFGEVATIL
jgi:nitroreductase